MYNNTLNTSSPVSQPTSHPETVIMIIKHRKNLIRLLKKMIFFYVTQGGNINMEQQM